MASSGFERIAERVRALHVPVTAAAVLALGALFLALDITIVAEPPVPIDDAFWPQLGILVLGCVVLLWKQRAPVAVLAAATSLWIVDVAIGGSLGSVLVFFDALYSAVLHGGERLRRALLVVIVVISAGGIGLALALTHDPRVGALTALQLFAVLVTPYWWALAVQRERARSALEAQRADDLERLAELTQQDAVLRERSRMARDLHDAIASELSAIAIHSEAALAAPQPQRASLETIRAASIRSLEQMRSMILVLRSGGDLPAAPDRLSDASGILDRARQHGLEVRLEGTLPTLPVAVDQAAGRILQESLTNAMKHAPGSPVVVRTSTDATALRLEVESAGAASPAFVPPPSAGLGVRLMRERARALGGDLVAGSDGGGGRWTVEATLPLRP